MLWDLTPLRTACAMLAGVANTHLKGNSKRKNDQKRYAWMFSSLPAMLAFFKQMYGF